MLAQLPVTNDSLPLSHPSNVTGTSERYRGVRETFPKRQSGLPSHRSTTGRGKWDLFKRVLCKLGSGLGVEFGLKGFVKARTY